MTFSNVFQNKSVIITGHTGFKGSWLLAWLKSLGAKITGISFDIPTIPSHYAYGNMKNNIVDYKIDIREKSKLKDAIQSANPDFIFHLAAQPIVKKSYESPYETWSTNLMGSLNILDSVRDFKKRCNVIMITSDKCYDNVEWSWGYRENDILGGPDPYSASKGATELMIKSYVKSYFSGVDNLVHIASARAGNVIGGGDWAENRIIPDCIKSWSKNLPVNLRNPNSTRPWQHVLEPLSGYLLLASNLNKNSSFHGEAYNFGPESHQNFSVRELVESMSKHWKKVKWNDISNNQKIEAYESNLLKLNCDKALHHMNWRPVLDFKSTVKMTAIWYKSFYEEDINNNQTTIKQISDYTQKAKQKGLVWAK
tara:strand:+ start:4416 stop:5516 length:1101 start_codon:yes stop_codon:yes gene_type:complete